MKKPSKGKTEHTKTSALRVGTTVNSKKSQFPIVGIGASAGGLEALEQFLANMPENSGMAFVIIQHLAPNYKGMMQELLQRDTEMEVITVTDYLKIKPNCVYIIPPNKSMSLLNGTLHLFKPLKKHGLRLPIDYFFRSLADDMNEESIGIILSGMGSDGCLGLKAIKEKAGFVLVQEPESAKFDSMPRAAIKSVAVDIIASANELPSKLLSITKTILRNTDTPEIEDSSLEKIIILLRIQTGNDFSQYKKKTLYRRIERRMGVHQIDKISSYVRYLQETPLEIEILFKELLIGVTNFFRDGAVWNLLRDKVLPTMFTELKHGQKLRAWIPGCSTGEEAYTWAIIFKEAIEKIKPTKNLTLQLFATDLDIGAINIARKGVYSDNIIADVSEDRLNRFFVKTENQFRVNAEIREMVVFAAQNIIKDPPFTKLDILSCRNMLIYMEKDLQKKLVSLFHYSLNHRGILLLGSAETKGENNNLFTTVDSKLHIYQSTSAPKSEELFDFPSAFADTKKKYPKNRELTNVPDNIKNLADDLLLQQFSPASVLASNLGEILYLTGNTGKYLTPAAGKASMNIFTMARTGLDIELPSAFRKVLQNYEKLILPNIKVGTNGGTQIVTITIQQIETPLALKGKIMVAFSDVPIEKQESVLQKIDTSKGTVLQSEFKQEIQRLNVELQTTHEEMQTSQEELKSTNEELQSSNEELQSANEELTTSKEEMQSLNEELHTVNAELLSKIDDSVNVTNDMNNLLNSSEIATLFLDKKMNIRQFTVHAAKIFKVRKSDIGRHYTDLANNLQYPEMLHDAKEVLRTLMFVEKTISSTEGLYYTIRIMPYRTFDDKIEGLVITFIDITKAKKIEIALLETQSVLKSFIGKVPGVIIGLSSNGELIEFNPEAEKVFGRKRSDVIGRNYFDLFIPKALRKKVESDMKLILSGNLPNRFENLVKSSTGDQLNIEWSAHKQYDEKGVVTGIITIGENITSYEKTT
ncbi:chemotaxis protein CheB [Maribacter sp. ACAM166]|uniref:chemotaxis protein CheB n=1 Tax=Maribacter sp. ACAM166 TaxID=2508996 RepID=UPI0010FE51DF|nr:chemotaxis protein CheB [Maribacter sp. ACAM166]TLP82197.1 PAS domain S-box protein [Maribacter sp. ACAM166]